MKKLLGSITLTKLISVVTKVKNSKGNLVDAIIIPIEANHLYRSEKNALYLNIKINIREEPDQYDNDGFIVQQVDSKKYKDASEQEKEKFNSLPILGNVRFIASSGDTDGVQPENSVQEVLPPEDGEDLPF